MAKPRASSSGDGALSLSRRLSLGNITPEHSVLAWAGHSSWKQGLPCSEMGKLGLEG